MELYGIEQLRQWVQLEADPNITGICERPLQYSDSKLTRVIDFWAATANGGGRYLLLGSAWSKAGQSQAVLESLRRWAATVDCVVELVLPHASAYEQCWYDNWTQILQEMESYKDRVEPATIAAVQAHISSPITVKEIITGLPEIDPGQVRAAICTLAHRGALSFLAVDREPITDQTQVERRETG